MKRVRVRERKSISTDIRTKRYSAATKTDKTKHLTRPTKYLFPRPSGTTIGRTAVHRDAKNQTINVYYLIYVVFNATERTFVLTSKQTPEKISKQDGPR